MLDFNKRKPDILDCLANLSNDEVFTPPALANKILDLLPPKVWTNKDLRFLDPACKSGVFLREAAKRLMEGLREAIPDEAGRREHIFKNMLFGMAITELTAHITRRSLYYSKDPSSDRAVVKMDTPDGNIFYENTEHSYKGGSCVHCGAPESADRSGSDLENHAYRFIHGTCPHIMKFDVIIGNPPYQLKDGGHGASASPLYQLFVQRAIAMNPRYLSMIIPSRWFAGGKGLDEFRAQMLGDRRLKVLVDHLDPTECFPGVDIQGGVCYFLWDREHGTAATDACLVRNVSGGTADEVTRRLDGYDVFIRFNKAVSILEKVRSRGEPTLNDQVSSQKPFGLRTNFEDYKSKQFEGAVKLYYRNKQFGWVSPNQLKAGHDWVDRWKVLTPCAYGERGAFPHYMTGDPFVCGPNAACTETYLVAGVYATEAEALNLEGYLRTRFLRFLVGLRKSTQHLNKDRFSFVPRLDMSESWNDQKLYAKYGLTTDEVAYIESMIKEMP